MKLTHTIKYFSLIAVVGIVLTSFSAYAQPPIDIPPETVDVSNQVMLSIYQDIIDAKDEHAELSAFGENALFKNKNGIYAIIYEYAEANADEPYSFGITINDIDSDDFWNKKGRFSYGFPKINLKIVGFFQKHPIRSQYDIMPVISEGGMILSEYQQKFMPLRVFIRPIKQEFRVKEDVEFDVILRNVSKRHMVVKDLSQNSLYILMGNRIWGTNPLDGKPQGKNVILKSGEEIELRLKDKGFSEPQNLEMTCFYGMSLGGVNPMAKTPIRIVE